METKWGSLIDKCLKQKNFGLSENWSLKKRRSWLKNIRNEKPSVLEKVQNKQNSLSKKILNDENTLFGKSFDIVKKLSSLIVF